MQENTEEFQQTYAKRVGIEGTISQGVRTMGLRRSRYIGQEKTHLQHVATACAQSAGSQSGMGERRSSCSDSAFCFYSPLRRGLRGFASGIKSADEPNLISIRNCSSQLYCSSPQLYCSSPQLYCSWTVRLYFKPTAM
jgi:hypothetical protein